MLIVEHLFTLTTRAAALLTANLLALLLRGSFAILLLLENKLGELTTGEPAIYLAASIFPAAYLEPARRMEKPNDIRGLVRLLAPGTAAQDERLFEIFLEKRRFHHQRFDLSYGLWRYHLLFGR